jgi:hypothetical protein
MNKYSSHKLFIGLLIAASLACNALNTAAPSARPLTPVESAPTQASAVPTATFTVVHAMQPAEIAPKPGKMIYDEESSGTGPEGRAPYGDSYKLNRFERPFLQDMTYVPDLDIHKFGVSEDEDWYYVSIQLIGDDPNREPAINYGAEIDLNADGFGDYVIWAHPPYQDQWDTSNVQVFQDSNLDAGGMSSTQSDAVFDGDGYDTLVFDGSTQENADPDYAWVRWIAEETAIVQIAFKKSWSGSAFMVGVVSDAGLKDISKFDYNDYITSVEAGSPVRENENYPLGSLYAVDNTCWEPYGIKSTGFEPKACQPIVPIVKPPSGGDSDDEETVQPAGCTPDSPTFCYGDGTQWSPYLCDCSGPPPGY